MNRLCLFAAAFLMWTPCAAAQDAESTPYADFVEEDFPFITTTVVADTLADAAPAYNWTVRGLVVQLGAETFLCFDPDLLRMAVAWEGEFLAMVTMAQVSYHRLDKGNQFPYVLGEPIAATGMYAGWTADPVFEDPRPQSEDPEDPGKGPLAGAMGTFEGVYVHGADVVFSYRANGTGIHEQPGLLLEGMVKLVTRTFEVGPSDAPLTLVAAEMPGAREVSSSEDEYVAALGDGRSAAVFAAGAGGLSVREGRYVTLELPASEQPRRLRIALWRGPGNRLDEARRLNDAPVEIVEGFRQGGPARWPHEIDTRAAAAPDTNAFVYDHLELPDPNPWRRNVRPADLAFFSDGRAAVVTFDGDVWIANGFAGQMQTWRRFASGLYEPLAIEVVGDDVYAYGREGIVRLRDLNGDGEADFYEAFAPGIVQSTISREWPFDIVERPGGGFFVSQGGALSAGPQRRDEAYMSGFMQGSPHNGSVMEVSSDGRTVRRYATGFRAPYLGIHPESGLLTASDQQGNFVPSTPLYVVEPGEYYGVPPTAHRPDPLPQATPPLTWIPHRVDPSATSQVWMTGSGNGPLDGHMVHLSYGRSGLFRVYLDSLADPVQGGVAPLPDDFASPTLKGAVNPVDGKLYVTGFQVWGSTAEKLASLRRLRYTGRPSDLPDVARAGRQGILLTFETPVETPETADLRVRRWNYLRTGQYGSGHYRPDGSEGEEAVPVAGVHLSNDGKALLVVLPDMQEVMQTAVEYDLERPGGDAFSGTVYLTVNDVRPLRLEPYGLGGIDWEADLEGLPAAEAVDAGEPVEATALRGRHLYHEVGCVACHSTDGTEAGRLGPSFEGLYGSTRTLSAGDEVTVDAAYLRRSILDPGDEVVAGFEQEMPSFRGILGEGDIESIILYIKSLSDETDE